MEEGTIISCMVKVGDEVKKGDCVFEIETDKATLEMESPADGFVKHILAELDETLPVGAPLMVLGDKDEEVPQSFLDSLKAAPPAAPATEAAEKPATATVAPQGVPRTAAEAKLGATIPVNRLQKLIAERMLKSKREIPCFYLTVKADVTDLVELRAKLNKTSDVKVSYNDFIIRAVATGVEKFPIMTGQLEGDIIKLADTINIGLAVSAPKGLIAPVVKDAHKKDVKQIATTTKALIEKAQNEKLLLTDLEGACITVSNLGVFGIESFIPIVIPGQCSILGVGRITDACVPDNDSFAVRKLMSLTLSVDHKVADGAYASQFLDLVRKLLEDTSTFE
jgi:pyruvate dehydrogenase E2 component (dihydrolipoamide acetyltransferase)